MEATTPGAGAGGRRTVAEDVAIVGLVRDKGQLKELANMQTVHKWACHFRKVAAAGAAEGRGRGDAGRHEGAVAQRHSIPRDEAS